MSETTSIKVICYGEVLWDHLPSGRIVGGAPLNVAVHATQLGLPAGIISRIGEDEAGQALLAFLAGKGLPTDWMQRDPAWPTGAVHVRLDEEGSPRYEIVEPSAWDHLVADADAALAVRQVGVLVYGSLACRREQSLTALLTLLPLADRRVFDVNLRPPFYSRELLDTLLSLATLVKMNGEELDIIAGWHGLTGTASEKMAYLCDRYSLSGMLLTQGAEGASYLDASGLYRHPGIPVRVSDTIGSGDAFLAAFLSRHLKGSPPTESLRFACATGALVASRPGGTPDISDQAVQALLAGGGL
ncbi:MAG: hypothetical protein RLY31_793 [Bacteroidota bacterium]|jgi:fructokinase